MTKNNLPVGTRVSFYINSQGIICAYQAEGTIVRRFEAGRNGSVSYSVRVLSGVGEGKDWTVDANAVATL